MAALEGRLIAADSYRLGEPVKLTFELRNTSDQDCHVLRWFTPLEGLNSDCLTVTQNGREIPYDGRMVKRGQPPAAAFELVRAGQVAAREIDLSEAYSVSSEGTYTVTLDTSLTYYCVEGVAAVETLLDARQQPQNHELRGAGVEFDVVRSPGGGGARLTQGEQARKQAATPVAGTGVPPGPLAAPLAPQFTGGTATQQGQVTTAHNDGFGLCGTALAKLKNDAFYTTWFGVYTAPRAAKVQSTYTQIRSRMSSTTFTYNLTGTGCQAGWYAYTHKGGTTIWICGGFWGAPSSGADSKPGVIVHEHSHSDANTDDLAYGQSACRALAASNPDDAVRNADNYEYYAELS